MWAEVKSYISASPSFKKKKSCCQVLMSKSTSSVPQTQMAEGIMKACSSQPSFLLPNLGLLVHVLIKNIPLYYWSDLCDLSMEIGKFYLIVLQCALGSGQSC